MKVAICGGGTGYSRAPVRAVGTDLVDGWECWGQNLHHQTYPFQEYAWDRWFELHPIAWQEERHPRHMHELRRVREGECAIYMQEKLDSYPAAVRYPREKVEALTPHGHYHQGTFDFMVALAILEGAGAIALHGVTLVSGEPLAAKACLEYWLGIAEGRGIEVTTEPWSDVFKGLALHSHDRQYGYDWNYRTHHWVPATSSFPELADLFGLELDEDEARAVEGGTGEALKAQGYRPGDYE